MWLDITIEQVFIARPRRKNQRNSKSSIYWDFCVLSPGTFRFHGFNRWNSAMTTTRGSCLKNPFFLNFTMSLLYMDNQLCDMFTTIVRSRKTKQTSHLPTWLVSVDFQQLQFLAFLSLTFSSLSFSTSKERVVNICYIIAKIYSICAELFSDYTPMIPYGVREWSCRRYKTQDAKMTSYRVLFFSLSNK